MKNTSTILSISLLVVFLAAGSAMAVPFGDGGAALQAVLDSITTAPSPGDSSITVATDALPDDVDSYWAITATGGSVSTMIIEIASFADLNTFGVYEDNKHVQLFGGGSIQGDQSLLSIKADGSVYVNFTDTGIDFAGNQFGFYINSPDGLFYSDTSRNVVDNADHMAAYQGLGIDTVQLPGLAPGVWTDNEFVLAFEDLNFVTGSDRDYTDLVVMVESIIPTSVPDASIMLLLGSSLLGLAVFSRNSKRS